MRSSFVAAALACLTALPAAAQDRFAIPVTAQVLPGWVRDDGARVAAVQLSLEPGWKTYWRAPGDAGIPPSFDWSGSRNLHSVAITWPTPQVFDQNGMRSIGYEDELVIPLVLAPTAPGEPIRVRLDMEIGICSDICIPHSLNFDETLTGGGSKPTPAIAAALAQSPYSAQEAGVTAATCRIEPTKDGLRIEARVTAPSAGAHEVMVIEPGLGDVWVSEAQTHRTGGDVIAVSEMIHVEGGAIAVDRSAIRLTVLGSSHAIDIRGCSAG
ncbi:protein-disulfide reductase DsbD domain-containing protein [uncultured Roseobacter sp.]|uniref:protein-disulfide reductase DsbD domain-containing protein n=1 Tax=uncultured Roseobacter sp. TaxID=114847 RepID=UPI002625D77A|nr:protein-disulfide reductase DsbD domain-containing protein [uncultured Roseobacter sp.]